jgi:hypothetical protein
MSCSLGALHCAVDVKVSRDGGKNGSGGPTESFVQTYMRARILHDHGEWQTYGPRGPHIAVQTLDSRAKSS